MNSSIKEFHHHTTTITEEFLENDLRTANLAKSTLSRGTSEV